jgi:hypothetical protein
VTNKSEPNNHTLTNFNEPDHLLAALVTLVNKLGGDTSITLSMKGTILSGQLISGKEYFKLLSIGTATANTTNDAGKEFKDALAIAFVAATKKYPQIDGDNTEEVEKAYASMTMTYLHIKNVFIITGNIFPSPRNIWRLRLSEIDGWSLNLTLPNQN